MEEKMSEEKCCCQSQNEQKPAAGSVSEKRCALIAVLIAVIAVLIYHVAINAARIFAPTPEAPPAKAAVHRGGRMGGGRMEGFGGMREASPEELALLKEEAELLTRLAEISKKADLKGAAPQKDYAAEAALAQLKLWRRGSGARMRGNIGPTEAAVMAEFARKRCAAVKTPECAAARAALELNRAGQQALRYRKFMNEPDFKAAFEKWQQTPTAENLKALLQTELDLRQR